MERKDTKEKCLQTEQIVQNIFQSPNSWINGFIRLVSLEGTWYHHRETDIFVPLTQSYIDKSYKVEGRPERGPVRLKSGVVAWDYLEEEEGLKIIPNLPSSSTSKSAGTAGLAERVQKKRVFLKDGRVYDEGSKTIRQLQPNEEGTVLQVFHLEEQYQRIDYTSWNYDIYLWAKAGVIPSVLYVSKECWNTMQFLINNFNNIDFGEFLSQGKKESKVPVAQKKEQELVLKKEAVKEPEVATKPEEIKKEEVFAEPKEVEKKETFAKPEAVKKEETFVEPEAVKKEEAFVEPKEVEKRETFVQQEAVKKEEIFVEPEAIKKEEAFVEQKIVGKEETFVEPEAVKEEVLIEPEAAKKEETFVEPEAAKEEEAFVKPEAAKKEEAFVEPEVAKKEEVFVEPEAAKEEEAFVEPEAAKKEEGFVGPEAVKKEETFVESETVKETEVIIEAKVVEEPEVSVKPGAVEELEVLEEEKEEVFEEPKVVEEAEVVEESEVVEEQEVSKEAGIVNEAEGFVGSNIQEEPEIEKEPETFVQVKTGQSEGEGSIRVVQEVNIVQKKKDTEESMDRIQSLLECDKNRCRLEPYDKDILYDIIRGHWELFEAKEETATAAKENKRTNEKELMARDPKLDIRQGVVGIDFGTKSTVVVRQDATNRIVPIRIGTGNLSDEVKEEDYENPSIIEFTNVEKFLEEYYKEEGRPHTSCNDIFVSYDAYEDFRNCKPDDFYAYFSELKQWANHEKGSVIIKDKQRKEYNLGERMGLEEGTINPIELYAYYIGLYINNMRNGIYLKYLMTFPVGYAKEVRDFIANSFYEGIKKSLPSSILNDKDCMDQFKVELGISEPAAYAVTALEQSNLEPKDETESLMYGIFDFGGGTTDFDFGICRGATDEEYEKEAYDYVLECFGADSDVTLGGENILELMSYQVYQENLEVFREKKIPFILPSGENSFAGSETLLINSQIAKRNMTILKEELRPLWHQEQGWRKKYQLDSESQNEADKEGIVVSLYNMDGEPVPQCILEFASQELVELIKNRIQRGIDSFFQCLIKIFLGKKTIRKEENNIYIFLAGNSSKSIFVKELFQKKIEEYYSKSKKLAEGIENVQFNLIDPLTGEGGRSDRYVPNAKTGVAYGLLKSRPGSSIKINKNYETDAMQQSRFHYYLGRDHRHYFDCKFSPAEIEYKKWVSFQGATREVVRIYYTNNPMADSKMEQMSIENVPYKEITIETQEDACLFIRTVEPDMIEYVVAKEIEDISTSEVKKCYFNN